MKPEADLDNFRGMKWGMDINKLPESDSSKQVVIFEIRIFSKKSEDLDVLGVKATDIRYNLEIISFTL